MTSQHADAIAAEYCLAEGGNVTRLGGRVRYSAVQAGEKLPRAIDLVATGPSGHASRPLQGMRWCTSRRRLPRPANGACRSA